MLNINIINKLENCLISLLKDMKIFKNLKDGFYYLRQENTLFVYYIDIVINTRKISESNELNIFYNSKWNLLVNTFLNHEELVEYKNSSHKYFIFILNSIIDENKILIPEVNMEFNIIEFNNGIYNLKNNIFINFSAISYIYNEFIQLNIKAFIYTSKNYKVGEIPISVLHIFGEQLSNTNSISEINEFMGAVCIFLGYSLQKNGIYKLLDSFIPIRKIIDDKFIKKKEINNILSLIFFNLKLLISSNTINRNKITKLIFNDNFIESYTELDIIKFLSNIYSINFDSIKLLNLNESLKLNKDLYELDYIMNTHYSLRQPNSLFSWYSNMELDNYIIFLIYSNSMFSDYIYSYSRIIKNHYLNLLDSNIHNEILLFSDNDIIECLNNQESLLLEYKDIIKEKQNIVSLKIILKKLLFF